MRRALGLANFVSGAILALFGLTQAQAADESLDRAAALTATIDWVRQTGEDKVVPQNECARFLLICGANGATFKFKSAKGAGGIVRGFMWIGGRTALLSQIKQRAIYLVLDPGGAVVRITVVNLANGKERDLKNDDPAFNKLLPLEIKFWQTQVPRQ